jgi:N-hydroxyarylamine O-acetyltransferase
MSAALYDAKLYFKHINFEPTSLNISFELLSDIVRHHLQTFYYQNTYLFAEGKKARPSREIKNLHKDALFQEMIIEDQPGYCFQNNELLAAALDYVGFSIQKHLAITINQPTSKLKQPEIDKNTFSHEVLIITLNNNKYLVDTGYAHESLREPLKLEFKEHTLAGEQYRLVNINNNWRLDIKRADKWFSLYQVSAKPCSQQEIEKANALLFLCPSTIIIRDNHLLLAHISETSRACLFWRRDGSSVFRTIANNIITEEIISTIDNYFQYAEQKFKIILPARIKDIV